MKKSRTFTALFAVASIFLVANPATSAQPNQSLYSIGNSGNSSRVLIPDNLLGGSDQMICDGAVIWTQSITWVYDFVFKLWTPSNCQINAKGFLGYHGRCWSNDGGDFYFDPFCGNRDFVSAESYSLKIPGQSQFQPYSVVEIADSDSPLFLYSCEASAFFSDFNSSSQQGKCDLTSVFTGNQLPVAPDPTGFHLVIKSNETSKVTVSWPTANSGIDHVEVLDSLGNKLCQSALTECRVTPKSSVLETYTANLYLPYGFALQLVGQMDQLAWKPSKLSALVSAPGVGSPANIWAAGVRPGDVISFQSPYVDGTCTAGYLGNCSVDLDFSNSNRQLSPGKVPVIVTAGLRSRVVVFTYLPAVSFPSKGSHKGFKVKVSSIPSGALVQLKTTDEKVIGQVKASKSGVATVTGKTASVGNVEVDVYVSGVMCTGETVFLY